MLLQTISIEVRASDDKRITLELTVKQVRQSLCVKKYLCVQVSQCN